MADLGYYRSKADPSVRSCHANGEITITSTYTDDTTGVSSSKEEADRAKEKLGRTYETKDLGEAGLVLGIKIERNREAGTLSISQHGYLERVLEKYGMMDCTPKATPLPLGLSLSKAQGPTTPKERHFMTNKPYREVLGSVMYAQVATCQDLSYAVSTLSKYSSNPGKPHWDALMHVLWYIKGRCISRLLTVAKALPILRPWVTSTPTTPETLTPGALVLATSSCRLEDQLLGAHNTNKLLPCPPPKPNTCS